MLGFLFPRQRVTRLAWCRFAAVVLLLCGVAYLAGECLYRANGGIIFFAAALLLLAVPFLLLSVRRMKDAELSPWGLTVPPLLFCLGLEIYMLAETDPKSIGGMTGQDAGMTFLALILMGIAAPASAAVLMLFMTFVKGREVPIQ